MKSNISKSVKYLIGLCVAGLCACGIYVSLAYANVCFLPSGLCDFNESQHQYDFVYTTPGGDCTGDLEHDKSKCCLLSPLPHFKCEQCDNGRFKCDEECINNDYQLINNRGTRQSECVCKGDACGSIPTSTNNKDLRDQHCSVSLNSCGLCPENKCVCNGEKCSARNTGGKKYECSTSKTNVCGNCPTDRNATCECVNCCDVFGNDWYSESDSKCKYVKHTKDGTACYKPYNCPCTEEFPGSQAGDVCPDPANQRADFVGTANGEACYKCRSKSCSDYSDSHTTYHDTYSDRNERCQDYEIAHLNDKTCYIYTNISCDILYSGYSGVSLFLNSGNLREGYSDCYSFTEKNDCKDYTGTCYLGKKKGCADRGLLSTQPNGKICDAISACDITCFDPGTCRTPGPGCIENGGTFTKSDLDCDDLCIIEETYPADEGQTCYRCDRECDPCKKINSAYRKSASDPCENDKCCNPGYWSEVDAADAEGRTGCYKCKSCEEYNSALHSEPVANCITQNIKNSNNCYVCPTCFMYGVLKRVYPNAINQTKYPAYQENQCSSDKVQIEVSETNTCYQCPTCNEFNNQWQAGSTCSDSTKTAKPVIGHSQCKKCVKCPDSTWSTTRPTGCGDVATQKDDDTGYTCYKCRDVTCANYNELPNPDSCTAECYGPNPHDHDGLTCYTCDKLRTCEEVLSKKPEYRKYSFPGQNEAGLECKEVPSCGRDCWACQTCEQKNPNWHTGSKPGVCSSGVDEKVADTKNCYKCTDSSTLTCQNTLSLPIIIGDNGSQTTFIYKDWIYDPNNTDCADEIEDELAKELVETLHQTVTVTAEDGSSIDCKYRQCITHEECQYLGYISADDIEDCPYGNAYQVTHLTGIDINLSPYNCYQCIDCAEINPQYKNAIRGDKETVRTCPCKKAVNGVCEEYDESSDECITREVQQISYPCPSEANVQYQGTPVYDERYPGVACYTCPGPKPTCADKGYRDVSEQCPSDLPNRSEKWIDEEVGTCLLCEECPESYPRNGSYMDEALYREQCVGDGTWGETTLNAYNQSLDKETFIKQHNKTNPANQINENNIDLFLDCAEAVNNHTMQCCQTCMDAHGITRCKTSIPNTGTCEAACASYRSDYKEVSEGCPEGEKPYKVWVPELNRECIYNCVPKCEDDCDDDDGGSSSGGGGSGRYYHQDSLSDVIACASCCTKEVSAYGETLVVKIGAPGKCQEICNEARCCYQTPGNEHDDETAHHMCSFEAINVSGTCNPMDSDMYFKCPSGYACVPDSGSISSFEGHCLAYDVSEDSSGDGSSENQSKMPTLDMPTFDFNPGEFCGNQQPCQKGEKCCKWSVWTTDSCVNSGVNMYWKCQPEGSECRNRVATCSFGQLVEMPLSD